MVYWSAQSLDLNPIEHLWDELEYQLHARSIRPKAKQEEWKQIPSSVYQELMKAFPKE